MKEKSSVCVTITATNLKCRRPPSIFITCHGSKNGKSLVAPYLSSSILDKVRKVYLATAPPSSILPPPTSSNHTVTEISHLYSHSSVNQTTDTSRDKYSPYTLHLLQTHLVQKDPRTLEFMSIENLKTFGESAPPFLTLDLEMIPRYCCFRVAQITKDCSTSCYLTMKSHSGLSLENSFVTIC
jgi:hypothetical protein